MAKRVGGTYFTRIGDDMTEWIERLTELSKQYNFKLNDVPDILEEYILIDNEVIEQKNIENLIKEAYNNERTHIGQSVLKQLLEAIQWTSHHQI